MRLVRVGAMGLLIVGLALIAGRVLVPLAARGFIRALEMVMSGCLWFAMALSTGVSIWSVLATIGRAAASSVATSQASMTLGSLALVAVVAVYALQRLLGSREESSR